LSGRIVVLNGAPRAGKSSIAAALHARDDETWMHLGVDTWSQHVMPARLRPGIGLRPGGAAERPEVAAMVPQLYAGLWSAVAAISGEGLDVVVDVGLLGGAARDAAARLAGHPAYLVGVRCPIEVVLERREATGYHAWDVLDSVERWQHEVHQPGVNDLEVDTSIATPADCAEAVRQRLATGPPSALDRLR
jgi:chloramphenicol 3-O phosphotransferase